MLRVCFCSLSFFSSSGQIPTPCSTFVRLCLRPRGYRGSSEFARRHTSLLLRTEYCACFLCRDNICVLGSGGPLSALTCCVNVRLLSGDKKNIAVNLFSKLGWELGLYYASYDDFHPDILARMYT